MPARTFNPRSNRSLVVFCIWRRPILYTRLERSTAATGECFVIRTTKVLYRNQYYMPGRTFNTQQQEFSGGSVCGGGQYYARLNILHNNRKSFVIEQQKFVEANIMPAGSKVQQQQESFVIRGRSKNMKVKEEEEEEENEETKCRLLPERRLVNRIQYQKKKKSKKKKSIRKETSQRSSTSSVTTTLRSD